MNSNSNFAGRSALGLQKTKRQITAPDSPVLPERTKRSVGRPSKYEPAFCERVIELATAGGCPGAHARAISASLNKR